MNDTILIDIGPTDVELAVELRLNGGKAKECCPIALVVRRTYPTAVVYAAAWRAVVDPKRPSDPSAPLLDEVVSWVVAYDSWVKRVEVAFRFGRSPDPEKDLPAAIAATSGRPASATFVLPVPA